MQLARFWSGLQSLGWSSHFALLCKARHGHRRILSPRDVTICPQHGRQHHTKCIGSLQQPHCSRASAVTPSHAAAHTCGVGGRPRSRRKSPILAGLVPCGQCHGKGVLRRHTPNFTRLAKLEIPLALRVSLAAYRDWSGPETWLPADLYPWYDCA